MKYNIVKCNYRKAIPLGMVYYQLQHQELQQIWGHQMDDSLNLCLRHFRKERQ